MSDELLVNDVKSKKGARLGRGLGSLLGEHASGNFSEEPSQNPAVASEPTKVIREPVVQTAPARPAIGDLERIWSLPIEQLCPNPEQPRRMFEPAALSELASSIKEKGILQPIVAKKTSDNKFEIISGERRWRASQQAGLSNVPVILRKSDPQDSLELALIENIQQENLNPVEEAEAYEKLVEQYGLTQQQIAEKVGKDRVTIANSLRLLNLPREVREWLAHRELSVGQAKVLLSLEEPGKIKKAAQKAKSEKMTVRSLEKYVAKILRGQEGQDASADTPQVIDKIVKNFEEELQKVIGTKVVIDYAKSKGKLSMYFYSDEELNYMVEMIRDSWSS